MSAVSVLTTIVTIPLMDRTGRRTLQLIGLGGIAVCFAMITVGLNVDTSISYLFVVLFTMMFMMFFVTGPGTIPWVATGELFIQGPRLDLTHNNLTLRLGHRLEPRLDPQRGPIIVTRIDPQLDPRLDPRLGPKT